jgi:accessory colonization factor AcfC
MPNSHRFRHAAAMVQNETRTEATRTLVTLYKANSDFSAVDYETTNDINLGCRWREWTAAGR